MLIGFIILAGILTLTFFIVFRQISPEELWRAINSVNPVAIVLGLIMMFIFACGEGLNIVRPLKMLGYDVGVFKGLKYATIGFFFSSVTPSSTGGQPMQIYYMHEDGIKVSHGILALLVQLFGWSSAATIYAVIGFLTQQEHLIKTMGETRWFLLVGIAVDLVLFVGVFLLLYVKRILYVLKAIVTFVMKPFKGRIAQRANKAVQNLMDEYGESAGAMKGHPEMALKTILTGLVQFLAMHSIPFIVYKGLGLSGSGFFEMFLLQAVLFVGVGFIPIPGAVGATEGMFMLIFRGIFPAGLLAGAMLICRSLSLYLCILIDAVLVVIFTQMIIRKKRKMEIEQGG